MTTQPKLLEGIHIVDLTSVIFGPYCTQTLADMGADVIKIEAGTGDPLRWSGQYCATPGMGALHMTVNRGKRSIVLDLKTPHGAEAMRRLIARADIFIHNVREAAIERLGFGYDQVRALRPDIIYVHCRGYGADGPYADLPAYDDAIQAASGATTLASRVDGDPAPRYMPSAIVDKVAGLHAAYATLAAYVHRQRTGEGQHVSVPMFESFTHFMLEEHLCGGTFDPPLSDIGYRRQLEPHRQPFPTADGHISIVPYGDANWLIAFAILGRPDIADDPRFATPALRTQNAETLYRMIGELTPARSTAEWVERMQAAEIPAVAVRDIRNIMDDPHLHATGFFRRREHPSEGPYFEMRPPVQFGAAPASALGFPPRLGEHTGEILAELGLAEAATETPC